MKEFETSAGTTTGNTHYLAHKNNQDGYYLINKDDYIIGVVCDGSSVGMHTEVGAKLFARAIASKVEVMVKSYDQFNIDLLNLKMKTLISNMIMVVDIDEEQDFFRDYLAFNVVGFCIAHERVVIFGIGDRVVYINGKYINNNKNNEGYFAAKSIFTGSNGDMMTKIDEFPANKLKSLLVGSDGVSDLAMRYGSTLPCSKEMVGHVKQFWTDDKYFNYNEITKKLNRANMICCNGGGLETETGTSRDNGVLPDDTTMIVVRKKSNL